MSFALKALLVILIPAAQIPVCKVELVRHYFTQTAPTTVASQNIPKTCQKGCCAVHTAPVSEKSPSSEKSPRKPSCPSNCPCPLCAVPPVIDTVLAQPSLVDYVSLDHLPIDSDRSLSDGFQFLPERPPRL